MVNTTALYDPPLAETTENHEYKGAEDTEEPQYRGPTINSTLVFQLCGGLMHVTPMLFKGQNCIPRGYLLHC